MRKYQFEDFKLDKDNRSLIEVGQYGMKIEISIFNPLVPEYYKEKAVDILNEFIGKQPNISIKSTDSIAVMLEAYIDENIDADKKYRLVIYLWNEECGCIKDYVIDVPILPTDEHFSEFEECVMGELRYMIFG